MNEGLQLVHITPDLPQVALNDIKDWRSKSKFNNVYHRVVEQSPIARCRNCGDTGFILISFTRAGPFEDVPNHKVGESITWFDGDEQCGKGWYIITNTISYDCHHCERSRAKADETPKKPIDPEIVQSKMKKLVDEKASKSYLHE